MKYLVTMMMWCSSMVLAAQPFLPFIQKYEGTDNFVIESSFKSSDGIFYVGFAEDANATNGTIGIMYRTDLEGEFQLGKSYPGMDKITDICKDANGDYYLGGSYHLSAGVQEEIALAKVDKDGAYIWSNKIEYYGGSYEESVYGLLALNNGNVLILGGTESFTYNASNGTLRAALVLCVQSTNGAVVWNKSFGGVTLGGGSYSRDLARRAIQMENNDISIIGKTNALGAGKPDVLHMIFTQSGVPVEMAAYGGAGIDQGFDIDYATTSSGYGYMDICGRVSSSVVGEEEPLWLRLNYTISGGRTYTGFNAYTLEDQTGFHDLDRSTRIRNTASTIHMAGTVDSYGSFLYRYNSSETSILYPQEGTFGKVVGLLGSSGAPKYIVNTEKNTTDRCYLRLTDDDLSLAGCDNELGNIERSPISITRTPLSTASIYLTTTSINNYSLSTSNNDDYLLSNNLLCEKSFSKIYTDGLNSSSVFDQLDAKSSLVNQNGNVVLLSRKNDTYPATTYSSGLSIATFNDHGEILSEKTFEINAAGQDKAFVPKSFVEKSAGKYVVVGEHNYEYTDPVTLVVEDRKEIMLLEVDYNAGTIASQKRYEFSVGDKNCLVQKIIAINDNTAYPLGYAILCSALNSSGVRGLRVYTVSDLYTLIGAGGYIEGDGVRANDDTYGIDMIQLGDGGDIIIAGKTGATSFDHFLTSLTFTGTDCLFNWMKKYESGTGVNKGMCKFKKLMYDGTNIIAAFNRDGYKNGIVHVKPADGTVIVDVNLIKQCYTFNSGMEITDVHQVDNDYLFSCEKTNNANLDLLTFRMSPAGALSWSKKNSILEFDKDEYGKFGLVNNDRYWSIANTESHNLVYNGTSSLPQLIINEVFINRGYTPICSGSLSNVNIGIDAIEATDFATSEYEFEEYYVWTISTTKTFNTDTNATAFDDFCGNTNVALFRMESPNESELSEEASSDLIHQKNQNINIFPNPAENEINIDFTEEGGMLRILNLQGAEVLKSRAIVKGFHTLDISALKTGVYIVQLSGSQGVYFEKFIKE